MREDGISIYLSLVRSKEASDVGIVVGGFFSGHPMKGGHWQKWTNKREGNFTSRWWGARKRAMKG
jgi:hypothetical protein